MARDLNPNAGVALITGAGSPDGIGFATARLLGRQGFRLSITSTTPRIDERARELRNEGCTVISAVADLVRANEAQLVATKTVDQDGRIDALINNAGLTPVGQSEITKPFADFTEAEWDQVIALNLKTAFHMTQAVLPHMLRAGYGRIVNVSSVTGPVASNPGATAYSAAKSAMVGLTRGLALEVARSGITVNAVAPGWIGTGSSTQQELVAGLNTPVGRPGTADEVAALIAFLASQSASYITGEMVVIDGGNTIQEYKGRPELFY
jgi:3-oxoacyl-[acyl-carrier protein] reductase